MIRAHIYISGVVQGVCYRHYTRETALGLGLTGWVRNCTDGRVEITVEGEKDSIEKLASWCHEGPSAARVSNVAIEIQEYQNEFSSFSVTY